MKGKGRGALVSSQVASGFEALAAKEIPKRVPGLGVPTLHIYEGDWCGSKPHGKYVIYGSRSR